MEENVSDLHGLLKKVLPAKGRNGPIVLHELFEEIKESARAWLLGYEKNGLEHSERLERYLNNLTAILRETNRITGPEIFVLLCAAYMHDLGYWHEGRLEREKHEKRSHDLILSGYKKYHLDNFPIFGDGYSRVAKAIGWVCYGHAREAELPLSEIPHDFPDQAFEESILDLRKLAALLRVADEADDPYVRQTGPSSQSKRSWIPLVEVEKEKVIWHWDRSEANDPALFEELLAEKGRLLKSSLEYLGLIEAGDWDLVLHPQATASAPFMAKDPVETFVGREKDLEELHKIIKERGKGAIIGVVGTGGIGKTALTRMYAKRYQADYPAGIFWASLKGSTWREEARKILEALYPGWQPNPFPDDARAKEDVCKRLDQLSALLVIDNVNEAIEIINPGCSVLVTTRNRGTLGILNRKAIHKLDGLSESEGKDLLAEVLGEERVARDPVGAVRIVKTLGGMPLALEIAAYHLEAAPDLSFPNYIGQIQGKIEELKIGDLEDKNVMGSLELSLKQLEGSKNGSEYVALFEAGSVCAESGFTSHTLAEAGGLGNMDRRTVEQLAGELYRRSLLEFDQNLNRYNMHPLLRQFSEARLENDKDREFLFRKNHCMHFLRFAEANDNSPEMLIAEKDGIRQAMVQANQIGEAEGLHPRFLKYLTRPYKQLCAQRDYESALQYLVLTDLMNIFELGLSDYLVNILQVLIENQAALRELSRSWVYTGLGIAYHNLRKYPKAIELYEKALEIAGRIKDELVEGSALANMGTAYDDFGEHRKAIEFFKKALEIHCRIGDVQGEGNIFGNMGAAYANLGEYHKAIELFEKALEIHRRIGDVQGGGNDLANIGQAYGKMGLKEEALKWFEASMAIFRRLGLLNKVAVNQRMMKSVGL
jgi:tetratricopeptide (TPR) repeat protein